jgi:Cytosol aminopeptidase family, N-terminal domain
MNPPVAQAPTRRLPARALRWAAVFVVIAGVSSSGSRARADAAHPAAAAAVGTLARAGAADGLAVDVKVAGPSTQATPLQVACVFEYVEGDITQPPALPAALNGMRHLDDSLHGLITELRKSGRFAGHALETLLIVPPKGTLAAERLLLIGLGKRQEFTPALLQRVGAVGMREALRLGVAAYSHASDIKDAGVDSPTAASAQAVVTGALEALATQRYLADKGASAPPSVGSLTLLAGPAFFAETTAAVRELLARPSKR